MNFERIYLDYAATTPLRSEVLETMREVATQANYNPSSPHAEGRRAAAVLDRARDRAAELLGAHRNEITFTGSGTESDNLAIAGTVRAARGAVVSAATEHHAVLEALEHLREEGVPATVLPVGNEGRVNGNAFAAALTGGTVLASVMYANNETGMIQPIAELAASARERGVLFHTDAVQAPNWLPLEVGALGVDLLSLAAHKFYGPKGVGLLYVRRGTPITPILRGGGQEFGRRSGTQNVVGIAGMVRALELAVAGRATAATRATLFRDRLEAGIRAAIPDIRVNGGEGPRLPNLLNVSFAGVDSAELLIALDLAGVAASAGSACTSGNLEPSHVLAAMGLEPRWARGAVRFSLGTGTTVTEIDRVLEILPRLVAELRRAAGALQGDG